MRIDVRHALSSSCIVVLCIQFCIGFYIDVRSSPLPPPIPLVGHSTCTVHPVAFRSTQIFAIAIKNVLYVVWSIGIVEQLAITCRERLRTCESHRHKTG